MKARTVRRLALAAIASVAAFGGMATTASAAWYWTEATAERALASDFKQVTSAICDGKGRSVRTDSGQRAYRRFVCVANTTHGVEGGWFTVLGKNRYKFRWQ